MLTALTQQIVEAFQLLENTNPEWLEAILNRPTGSQWGQRLNHWTEIARLPWERLPVTDRITGLHLPQCIYCHHVRLPSDPIALHPNATENIKLLSEFDSFNSIKIQKVAHGLELVSDEVQPHKTEEAWLIIGPQKDNDYPPEIVWTAYPGRIAGTVTGHPLWDGTLNCLGVIARTNIPIAVKGIDN